MSWFSRHRIFSLFVILLIPGLLAAAVNDPEEEGKVISISELPKTIQQALKGVEVDEIEFSSFYEVEIEENGVEIELRLATDGRLLGIEIETEEEDADDVTDAGDDEVDP